MEHRIENQISRFAVHLKRKEKAQATVQKYTAAVLAFLRYQGERPLDKELAIAYKQFLIEKGGALRSVNATVAALNAYFAFIDREDCRLKAVRLQRQAYCAAQKELCKAEYLRLVQAARKDTRLCLMLQTICATGIRVGELKFITVEALQSGEAVILLKGKTRRILLIKGLQKKLLGYCKERGITSGCVFRTRSGKPIDRVAVWRQMKGLCKRASVGEEKVFPHNLRHLFARQFYEQEKDIAKLADILGHSSINTTRIYIMTSSKEHLRRMERMQLLL